jgi:valyl-tRNA synthetase
MMPLFDLSLLFCLLSFISQSELIQIMAAEIAKAYTPADVEPEIANRWQDAGAFHGEPGGDGAPYSIVIPPPNVTAALHMGHALNNTLQDILIRWRRMCGDNAMWMPGTDHAGIATQTVVEKRVLAEEGKRRIDFERDDFIARIQTWKDEYEIRITEQLKAMGCSCDWDRQRFTMDPVCARAVREAFYQLFKDDLIYRGKRLVNWDPATQTALADDEVESQDVDGFFWYMRYPLVEPIEHNGTVIDHVTVATTRPETMLGDTGVAMNPADPLAAVLNGKLVRLPIVNREIPIVLDDYVVLPDPEGSDEKARFSSGFLKVTPAHDTNDWDVWQRHTDEMTGGAINVMAPDGSISRDHGWPEEEFSSGQAAAAEAMLGLDRYDARKAIVDWFKANDLLAEVRDYRHAVGHSYRSHVPVEPYLSDQWYVRVTDDRMAGAALRAMTDDQRSESNGCVWKSGSAFEGGSDSDSNGGLTFYPSRYAKTFQSWHENIRDWCISRQLWWGHRIPVWSCSSETVTETTSARLEEWSTADRLAAKLDEDAGQWYVCIHGEDDAEAVDWIEAEGFVQDPDVLDTWFSSALWPMSTMGWPVPANFPDEIPESDAMLDTWNPTNVLCTAREIITLWVSRMVMFNLYFRGSLPFYDVFIHAMIQDGQGQKMSKTLGNGVDPFDIIHSHGSDAMRFTLAAMTTHTQDVRMPIEIVCPHCATAFEPKHVRDGRYTVSAPTAKCPDCAKPMVSSYGLAKGLAAPSDEQPLARNTSEKFDYGRNFANKLWNAVRFAITNLEAETAADAAWKIDDLTLVDRWILSRLAETTDGVNAALTSYEFANCAQTLYDFFWRDLCDWYVEAVKPSIGDSAAQRQVLATCIDVILRLLHPSMPFITEKLWADLNDIAPGRNVLGIYAPPSDLLINAPWPQLDASHRNADVEAEFIAMQEIITVIRQVRTQHKVPPRQLVIASIVADEELGRKIENDQQLVESLARVSIESIAADTAQPANSAVALLGDTRIFLHDLIDPEEERKRLGKDLEAAQKNADSCRKRLDNPKYIEKAPDHLVQQTRDQLAAAEKEVTALETQLAALG